MGNFIHARTDLLISAINEGFDNLSADYYDQFITDYKQEIDDTINKKKLGKDAFGGKSSEARKVWDKLGSKIVDYAKNKKE